MMDPFSPGRSKSALFFCGLRLRAVSAWLRVTQLVVPEVFGGCCLVTLDRGLIGGLTVGRTCLLVTSK